MKIGGRKLKPLFAALVVDMDGRVNLNVHGNVRASDALGLPAQASNAFVVGFLRRDYGAAGLFAMQRAGQLTGNQTVVALTVMTLFIPCVANFLVMLRERGMKMGLAMAGFIIVFSFGVGALMHAAFVLLGVTL